MRAKVLICPACGWKQGLDDDLSRLFIRQELTKEVYPDTWRSLVHPFTCAHCEGEMIYYE